VRFVPDTPAGVSVRISAFDSWIQSRILERFVSILLDTVSDPFRCVLYPFSVGF
jgi:hypothetical protein